MNLEAVSPANDIGHASLGLDPLLSVEQTARYTGFTKATLQRDRTNGTGPRFVKLGKRRVAYRLSDLQAWLNSRIATSTADARLKCSGGLGAVLEG